MSTNEIYVPTIFVDADSCPVKEEIVGIASTFEAKVIFVASYNHVKNVNDGQTWVYVDIGKEEADLYILNHSRKQDIAVTQDIGLASTLLSKGVYVLSPKGILFEEKDIQTALDLRYLSAKARRSGDYGKGPRPFSAQDRERFVQALTKKLSNLEGF